MRQSGLQRGGHKDPLLRESAREQPFHQGRGLFFPDENRVIAAGGGVFPEFPVEGFLLVAELHHAGGDENPLRLETGQNV